MSKICPNCLHPVRMGVNYCGYCGASLVPTPQDPAPTVRSKGKADKAARSVGKGKRVAKNGKFGRSWVKFPITLMVVVILMALSVRFWPQILVFLGQAAILLRLT